jgi:ferrochelatase
MTYYLGSPEYEHGSEEPVGVLLVNLGTPDAPTAAAVRRFLAEFLWDRRVIEAPRLLWWLVLHGGILRLRPSRSAHAYQQIWTPQGSPLLVHSQALAEKVKARLTQQFGTRVRVALGMTYGSPSIASALSQLHRENVRRLVVLPLYPQYTGSTTGSVFDRVSDCLKRWRWLPELRFITGYHDSDAYIDASASSIREHWRNHPRQHLLFSFHGIPRSYVLAGDPYHCQCVKTARLVSERLGLSASQWSLSFQSQVGREEWLRPYTDELLVKYAKESHRAVTVVCPGFSVDCLETLEEIALRNRDAFLANGGESYDYIPALNASDGHAALLIELIVSRMHGWTEAPPAPYEVARTRQRALSCGAVR